ncbi:MAG: hypothetical protein IJI53_09490 [Clostridia bacterium]|nr:hypothetical protein [Clostridia bacterium]MBR0408254.1 hypothetical protein [Clostridia bacterium]
MKKKSIGFYLAAITCVLAVVTLVLLVVYSARGGIVQGLVWAAAAVAILCEAASLLGEKPWTDFTSIIGAVALAYVCITVFSDGIWNIAEAMNGIKMVGLPELANMNYTLAGVNIVAIITAIAASFTRKSKA